MTIKEFSNKNGLVFFWSTIILAILLLITMTFGCMMRCNDGEGYRYRENMQQERVKRGSQRPMMNGQGFQDRSGIIDNVQPQSTTSVNTSIENQ